MMVLLICYYYLLGWEILAFLITEDGISMSTLGRYRSALRDPYLVITKS